MKILASLCVVLAASLSISYVFSAQDVNTSMPTDPEVLVCKSPNAARFHLDKECLGLNKCKREIVTVTQSVAENEGLTCCGICCKKK